MSDIVKVIFDGDLTPLQAKQSVAKGELNAFVAESEASVKGINGVGDAIGISAQKGAESFSKYYKPVITDLSRQIQALGPGFEKVLGADATKVVRAELDDLRVSLQKLNAVGYESAVNDEEQVVALKLLQKELSSYQLQLAEVTQQHIFLAEAATASAAAEGESAIIGNMGSRPLQGFGGVFRGANVGVSEIEANAALQILGKLGVAVSSVALVGGVVAAGAAAILISKGLKDESEKRLEAEESISVAINKQVHGLQIALSDYAKIVAHLHDAENLTEKIAALVGQNDPQSIKALRDKTQQDNLSKVEEISRLEKAVADSERNLSTLKARPTTGVVDSLGRGLTRPFGDVVEGYTEAQKRQDISGAEVNAEKSKKSLAEAEEVLKTGTGKLKEYDSALKEITKNQTSAFDSNFKESVAAQERNRRLDEEQLARRIQSIKEGNAEVLRLTKGYKAEFETLYLGSVSENPFAQQMVQNAKSVENLKEKLAGVTPELRKTALALVEAANAQKSYTLQINSAFQTVDLRSQADRFRNPTQGELQGRLNDQIREFQRTSNSTNPDVLYGFQQNQKAIDDFNKNKTQDTLDQKLEIASRAKTDEQKAIADKAVTSFAGSLNPDDLTRSERSRIADAFERSAAHNESRQEEAIKIQRDLLATMKAIDKRGEALTGIANKGGKEALDITVKDQTSGGIEAQMAPKSPSPDDTKSLYSPDLLFAGPGGLSN